MASGDGINWLIEALRSLPWKRPNIGSRMNREVHVRIWERPEVRVLRAIDMKTIRVVDVSVMIYLERTGLKSSACYSVNNVNRKEDFV